MKAKKTNKSNWQNQLSVSWKDSVWFPPVFAGAKVSRPRNQRAHWPVQIITDPTVCEARAFNTPFMNATQKNSRRAGAGFTLIELLVVIAIIAILAAMLLPAIGVMKTKAKVQQAKSDMVQIGAAIKAYESTYNGRFPIPPSIVSGTTDTTFGGGADFGGLPSVTAIQTNAAVIAILMNEVSYGNGQPTPNKDNVLNMQKVVFLNAKKGNDNTSAGVGPDGEYRDPFGKPYIISIDTSFDERCRDAFYSRQNVSQNTGQTGLKALSNPVTGGASDNFEYPGTYLIWSFGPDGKVTTNPRPAPQRPPYGSATYDVNKDNILGWQE